MPSSCYSAHVPFAWSATRLPAAQPLAVYGFSLAQHCGALYLYGGRWGACGSSSLKRAMAASSALRRHVRCSALHFTQHVPAAR